MRPRASDSRARDDYYRERGGGSGGKPIIGKPATDLLPGVLDPPATINVWIGPWSPGSTATGKTVKANWSTGSFTTADFVVVTLAEDGGRYVSCLPGA